MFDARRRLRRLFFLLFAGAMTLPALQAQTPATTTITDVVYRADGTPAGGVLLISWPAFSTAGGQAVAAGSTSATLGTGGALTVRLVPNVGATPAGTVYTVVYQLNDGTAKTEYWVVPTNSPTTIAAVRTVLGTTTATAQLASQQYVNTVVAGKANDAAVVHLAGSESISGLKQFAVPPSVPTPALSTEVRWSDAGWGPANDRNLVGRFGTQGFTLPRLSRVQSCFLRQYDASVPRKYSRYSTALHVDYPL